MKQTINLYDFRRAFESIRPDNFSHEGLEVLFESLEQLADDCGQEMELDVIGLCCDFSESTYDELIQNYDIHTAVASNLSGNSKSEIAKELKRQAVHDYLNNNTFLVGQVDDDTVIYQDF